MLNDASILGVRFLSSKSLSAARTFLLLSFSFRTLAATSAPFLTLKSLPPRLRVRFSRFWGLFPAFGFLFPAFAVLLASFVTSSIEV